MVPPRLSVTVTNYNYGRFLAQNIESILGQSFGDFELILIDNASTDESVEVMRGYQRADARIHVVVHDENLGMYGNLREAVARSSGAYRVQVDADDWVISPDAFRDQVALLDERPEVTFVYSPLTMVGSDGRIHFISRPHDGDVVLPGADAIEQILGFAINDTGMMMRLDAYRRTAGYPEDSPHICDTQLAARLCAIGDVGYIDRPLYAFRQHGSNWHLGHHSSIVRDEILPMIDEAFDGPLAARIDDPAGTKRRIVRNALVHLPTIYIFNDERLAGWRMYWESFKIKPIDTFAQARTLALLARTLLGRRGYAWLRQRVKGGADDRSFPTDLNELDRQMAADR
jgi:glycosyltransferase involved in cell wall biosynthesis